MILLDTNIVIAFFNGNKSVLKRIPERIDSGAFLGQYRFERFCYS